MSARHVAVAVLALGLVGPASAHAGDPCPITISVVDIGVPPWAKPELKAKVKNGDPFAAKLARAAKHQKDCTVSRLVMPTRDLFPIPPYGATGREANLKISNIKASLVDGKRRFQCDVAARKLKHLQGLEEGDGSIVVYRGHSRILLAVPGWTSMCVRADKADTMSDKQIHALFNKLTRKLVADRHANP